MTEEKRKRKLPYWPWIAGLIIAIFLVIFFTRDITDSSTKPPLEESGDILIEVPEVVFQYLEFIRENEVDTINYNVYVAGGIKKLSTALSAISEGTKAGADKDKEIHNRLWKMADYIQMDQEETNQSDTIHSALILASDFLLSIQEKKFPSLASDAYSVKVTAEMIDSQAPASEQKEIIRMFFEEAATAIEAMVKMMEGEKKG